MLQPPEKGKEMTAEMTHRNFTGCRPVRLLTVLLTLLCINAGTAGILRQTAQAAQKPRKIESVLVSRAKKRKIESTLISRAKKRNIESTRVSQTPAKKKEVKETGDIRLTPVKRKGKIVNWHDYLGPQYRDAYHVMQGAATDGKYIYQIFWKRNKTKCLILKINAKTNKKKALSAPLKLYHGNDLAYDPVSKMLYVVYSDQQPFLVTIVDPKTLTIKGTLTVRIPSKLIGAAKSQIKALTGLVAITHNPTRKQFAMRITGKNDFLILDEAFRPQQYVTASRTPALRRQSMDCDDQYIYMCMDKAGSYNLIAVYDWTGRFISSYRIALPYEIESIYHIGKRGYGNTTNLTQLLNIF